MRRRPIVLLASGVALTLLLAACGTATLPVKSLTQSAATQVASTGQMGDQLVMSMFAPGGFSPTSVGLQALGVGALTPTATSPCVTWSPTTPVDNDGDGWKANATATYNCSSTSSGVTVTITGTVSETDKNDADPYSGTKATATDLKLTVSGSGSTSTITENLTWDLTKNSAGSYGLNYDFRLDMSGSGSNATFEAKGTPTYTADNAADPFAAGTFTFNGAFTLTDSGSTYQLTHTSNGVHFDSTCSSSFDGGQEHYADSNSNKVDITYSGCNSYTMTFNGTALP